MNISELVIKDAGGASVVARAFKVTPQAICKWGYGKIPADRVLDLVAMTGGKWTPQMVRPDIFGTAPTANREAA